MKYCLRLKNILDLKAILLTATIVAGTVQGHAVAVQYGEFISSPQNFNGFEGIGTAQFPSNTYSEGGITVSYVGTFQPQARLSGPGFGVDGVWTTWTNQIGGQGNYGWYGPGLGYTAVKLSSGANIQDIQFLAGSGWGYATTFMQYELLDDGIVTSSGSIQIDTGNWSTGGWAIGAGPSSSNPAMSYFGFSGGGFDEVRLQNRGFPDNSFSPTSFEAGGYDSFAIVSQGPATVPEHSSPAVFLLSTCFLGFYRRWCRGKGAVDALG